MRRPSIRFLAALALAASAATVPALAGSPYEDGVQTGQKRGVALPSAKRAPAGLFNCSFKEQRTKLERKNCGGTRF